MKTIKDYSGRDYNLSDEVYIILKDGRPSDDRGYGKDDLVRLISGVDGSSVPGYHFSSTHRTVCSIFAKQAEFCGIHKDNLRKVE